MLIIVPPPVDESVHVAAVFENHGIVIDAPERLNGATDAYSAAAEAAAGEAKNPFVELWDAFQAVEGLEKELLVDGIHLTGRGNGRSLQVVLDEIRRAWLTKTLKRGRSWHPVGPTSSSPILRPPSGGSSTRAARRVREAAGGPR